MTPVRQRHDNGYGNTQTIFKDGSSNLATKYPAFNAVKNFSTQAPANTTGWYLPAIGEWYDILENLGDVKMDQKFKTDASLNGSQNLTGTMVNSITAANNINVKINKASSGSNVDKFDVDGSNYRFYWSSSEFSAGYARHMDFNTNGNLGVHFNSKVYTNSHARVRCVLSF